MILKYRYLIFAFIFFASVQLNGQEIVSKENYLEKIKTEMLVEWPKNRTINLVFHGHSVPAGYFKTPNVNTLGSYPYLVLKEIKSSYPLAVVNVINTSIGGENSESGLKRFEADVLNHKPDVIFIDYALNDRVMGLERAKIAWEKMISMALEKNIKVILLTPSPDQRVDIKDNLSTLNQHAEQIKTLAKNFQIGFIDSYTLFKNKVNDGFNLVNYMSQINHPNEKGHQMIADEIMGYLK